VTVQVALAEWSNMDNAQLRELLEKGQILFQEEFAKVGASARCMRTRCSVVWPAFACVSFWRVTQCSCNLLPQQVVSDRRTGATTDKAVIDSTMVTEGVGIDLRLLTAASRVARKPLLLHCNPFLQFGGWGRYYFQVTSVNPCRYSPKPHIFFRRLPLTQSTPSLAATLLWGLTCKRAWRGCRRRWCRGLWVTTKACSAARCR